VCYTALVSALLSFSGVAAIKIGVAAAGALLLLLGIVLRRAGRPRAGQRWRDGLLIGLAALATLCWWELLQFHHVRGQPLADVHYSEFFHYYMGSKYFPELGYTELYHCTALAVARGGERLEAIEGRIRDLATNELETARWILSEQSRCTSRFSPERWQDFERDVAWFRGRMPAESWDSLLIDWGYNATPTWGLLGSALANTGPATDLQVRLLILVDPALLLLTWVCVARTFGWRVLCVLLIFWGTNAASGYTWTGGSYLRQGWTTATLVGLCLLRRERGVAAGFLLGCATLLRVFPGVMFAAIGAKAVLETIARRTVRPARIPLRVALGGLLAALTLLPLGMLAGGGVRAWLDFSENASVDWQPAVNKMGLRTVLAWDPATSWNALRRDFYEQQRAGKRGLLASQAHELPVRWRQARVQTFESRRLLYAVLALGCAAVLIRAGRGQPDWVVAILGLGLLPVAVDAACYYYAFLAAWALLSDEHPAIGVGLCALSALGGVLSFQLVPDELYPALSLASLAFVLWAAILSWRGPAGDSSFRPS
jgi:hypothetical protein